MWVMELIGSTCSTLTLSNPKVISATLASRRCRVVTVVSSKPLPTCCLLAARPGPGPLWRASVDRPRATVSATPELATLSASGVTLQTCTPARSPRPRLAACASCHPLTHEDHGLPPPSINPSIHAATWAPSGSALKPSLKHHDDSL